MDRHSRNAIGLCWWNLAGQVAVSQDISPVPSDGVYSINALGAQGGGNAGGAGADIYGEFPWLRVMCW